MYANSIPTAHFGTPEMSLLFVQNKTTIRLRLHGSCRPTIVFDLAWQVGLPENNCTVYCLPGNDNNVVQVHANAHVAPLSESLVIYRF